LRLTSRSLVAATVSPSCRSGAGMRAANYPVTTRAPLWSSEAAIRFALAAESLPESVSLHVAICFVASQ